MVSPDPNSQTNTSPALLYKTCHLNTLASILLVHAGSSHHSHYSIGHTLQVDVMVTILDHLDDGTVMERQTTYIMTNGVIALAR